MHPIKKKIAFAAIGALLAPQMSWAAERSAGEPDTSYNTTLLSLVGLMIVLLFVIGILASVLRQLSFVVKDKIKKDRQLAATATKALSIILLVAFSGYHAVAEPAADAKAAAPQLVSGISESDFYLIMGVLALELLVIFSLTIYVKRMLSIIRATPELQAKAVAQKSWFWDKFNSASSLEKEKDIMLDHDYDGIHELDNSLPPWWKYGFYLTIVVAVIYLYRFHISHDGPSQLEEYTAEMQKGEADKAAYLARSANNIDENNVTMASAAELADGKDIFLKNCSPCHVADGGGLVGPNLTDDYWLHGGSLKDVFKSIKYGWQDKGMKSWKDDLSPKQIQEVASFVKTLKGTHPAAPKAPQGDIYIEASQGKTDTTKTAKVAVN